MLFSLRLVKDLKAAKSQFIKLPPNSPALNVVGNAFPVLKKEFYEVPRHWPLNSKMQYAIEHKMESDCITKLVDCLLKRLEKVLRN